MKFTSVFLKMLKAYTSDFGDAFPSAAPESVLQVLWECNVSEPRSHRQIEQATKLPQPTVSKLIARMIELDWVERSQRDPVTSIKLVSITFQGLQVIKAFEESCQIAVKEIPSKRSTPRA